MCVQFCHAVRKNKKSGMRVGWGETDGQTDTELFFFSMTPVSGLLFKQGLCASSCRVLSYCQKKVRSRERRQTQKKTTLLSRVECATQGYRYIYIYVCACRQRGFSKADLLASIMIAFQNSRD